MGADGDRKGQTDLHATTVVFKFLVLEIFEFGELPNVVVHFVHFFVGEAKKGAVHIDVFAAGEFWVEPDAELNEWDKSAIDEDLAFFWIINAGENFEESRFAGAVAADDAEKLSFFDVKI